MANGEIIPIELEATSFLVAPADTMPLLTIPVAADHTLHATVTIGALMVSGAVLHTWKYLCQSGSGSGTSSQVLVAELHQNGGQPVPIVSFPPVTGTFLVTGQVPAGMSSSVRWTCELRGHLVEQAVT
jgi:hypothetical protein